MNRSINYLALILLFIAGSSFLLLQKEKPVFYIIGDSTVRNGSGQGKNQQWGWGSFMSDHLDTNKINVSNQAIGGRSSRTFLTEGRWDKITATLKPGDYVIMQFGHNDASPLDDTARARGTIKGIGEESKEIFNPKTGKQEVVYTFGWYMRKYIRETKAKGAVAIVCSPVPRDNWKEGKVSRADQSYGKWAREVAEQEGALFIDLNELVAARYEAMGQEAVKAFFPVDHTHTNLEGAQLNAAMVAEALRSIKPANLQQYFKN